MFKKMCLVVSLVFCFAVSAMAIPIYIGTGDGQDNYEDVYSVILNNNPSYGFPSYEKFSTEVEYDQPPELFEIELSKSDFDIGTQFASFKYDGHFDVWYVGGVWDDGDPFIFDNDGEPWSHALSHHREWGANPVPEPATMILVGVGLMGMGCTMRKKIRVRA